MARARKTGRKRKVTAWNRAFGAAARTCFATTQNYSQYGSCMRSELKSASGKRGRKGRRRRKRR